MTQYTVWLWPGAGPGLEPFTVDAVHEQDAVETVGESLKGTGYTISGLDFWNMVEETMSEGYSEEEAQNIVEEQYYPINGGEYYLFILNMRVERAGASKSRKPKGSANTIIPYGGGIVSIPDSYNSKPKGRKSKAKRRRLFGSRNVRYEDLPEKVRNHPHYIPGYEIRFPDGTTGYAESEVELMDGQSPGLVSYWTSVVDDEGRWWDVAFTFDLDYFMTTPWEALDWSGNISDAIHNSDFEMYATANGKPRKRRW